MYQPKWTRRTWLLQSCGAVAAAGFSSWGRGEPAGGSSSHPIDIGSRRELFVDDHLIDRLVGGAATRLHHPVAREVALEHDSPWEGTGSGYHSVFHDGQRYRLYYKAWHLEIVDGKLRSSRHPLFCCLAESDDGVRWHKPDLGIVPYQGSGKNNIVMASGRVGNVNVDAGHPAVFLDENPEATERGRYKAIFRSASPNGLLPFQSPDGIHWSPMTDAPILSGLGAFDSQNLAFWDPVLGKYRAYWRIFDEGKRAIRTATSDDLIHWDPHRDLQYVDSPREHLYTNQVKPYYRAPHILIGFPTRYAERGWSESMRALPEAQHRELRSSAENRFGTALTEGLLMASRDGVLFKRWNEAFLRPGIERPGTWHYGQQYIAWHVVETAPSLPGAPRELSLYAGESYWTGKGSALRRYTLRMDGFVSIQAPLSGGELITKPLVFSGPQLTLNFATSAAGVVRVEIQDAAGKPVPGFALSDCAEVFGDTIDRPVSWKGNDDVRSLAGRPVRLRFLLKDADLYSFRFGERTG